MLHSDCWKTACGKQADPSNAIPSVARNRPSPFCVSTPPLSPSTSYPHRRVSRRIGRQRHPSLSMGEAQDKDASPLPRWERVRVRVNGGKGAVPITAHHYKSQQSQFKPALLPKTRLSAPKCFVPARHQTYSLGFRHVRFVPPGTLPQTPKLAVATPNPSRTTSKKRCPQRRRLINRRNFYRAVKQIGLELHHERISRLPSIDTQDAFRRLPLVVDL